MRDNELLLEVFSEEIPAKMQRSAGRALGEAILRELTALTGKEASIQEFSTPRRIALMVTNLDASDIQMFEEIRGPRLQAGEGALNGFLKKYNITIDQIFSNEDFYFYNRPLPSLEERIRGIIEAAIFHFRWPKSMIWGSSKIRWVRPIHSILCLFNDAVLPIQIGAFVGSDKSYGHRFHHPSCIRIFKIGEYPDLLKAHFVIISPEERKERILKDVNKILTEKNLSLVQDDELLQEIVGLVEYPVVFLGQIDEVFMSLPKEVLITTLKFHQKYLLVEDFNGNLAPNFVIVSNISPADGGAEIIKGNERVLRARLKDAAFFIECDLRMSLAERVFGLKKLMFHTHLGTIYDKVLRVQELASKLAHVLGVDSDLAKRAAFLMKADLITEMVAEFPELQGTMGYYYALRDNEDIAVAEAIRDHYKPQGPHDDIPKTMFAAILAVADKLDTLQQMFSAGIKPTGSKDPYALRRAAIGILRIMRSYNFDLDFGAMSISSEVESFILSKLEDQKS